MYDVQLMLKEAIEKCKDIEVCGSTEILVDYLQVCLNDNKYYTKYWLHKALLHKIDYIYESFTDYLDADVYFDEAITKLFEYIGTNESLYSYANSIFESEKADVLNIINWQIHNRHLTITREGIGEYIKNIDSLETLLKLGGMERKM